MILLLTQARMFAGAWRRPVWTSLRGGKLFGASNRMGLTLRSFVKFPDRDGMESDPDIGSRAADHDSEAVGDERGQIPSRHSIPLGLHDRTFTPVVLQSITYETPDVNLFSFAYDGEGGGLDGATFVLIKTRDEGGEVVSSLRFRFFPSCVH